MKENYLSSWIEKNQQLYQKFEFKDFKEAMIFGNEIAELSEIANHHPTLVIGWGFVEVYLFTFSQNRITDQDWALAQKIQELH